MWPHEQPSIYIDSGSLISEVSRMLTHLLTDDLVVETQIAGGGSADLSSSICARKGKKAEWPWDPSFYILNIMVKYILKLTITQVVMQLLQKSSPYLLDPYFEHWGLLLTDKDTDVWVTQVRTVDLFVSASRIYVRKGLIDLQGPHPFVVHTVGGDAPLLAEGPKANGPIWTAW